jgi:hypothetical protein
MEASKARLLLFVACIASATGCRQPNGPAPQSMDAQSPTHKPAADPAVGNEGRGGPTERIGKSCNIESIDGMMFAADPLPVTGSPVVRGWLGDEGGRAIASPALVLVDDAGAEATRYAIVLGIARGDVAAAFPRIQGLGNSGFEFTMPSLPSVKGTYRMHLEYSVAGQMWACDNGRRINTAPPEWCVLEPRPARSFARTGWDSVVPRPATWRMGGAH